MDKLLELIKEYWVETFDDKKLSKIEYEEKSGTFYWKYQPLPGMKLQQGQILHRTTVLSKDFGFVEWLVENEKIDLDKAKILESGNKAELFEFIERADYMKIRNRSYFSEYKQLLMLLSIQDEPINFLISILK